ncbi:PEP-CTERM sorting domain-containing protein [Methylobacillus gramineus]|uniref:PEP-CTERM sorting domain-containing protein n=1 Tax=Methylobacillus gramineus TaxID=755169 RepID=UPI001CFF67F1|nr:PEP-CTERM sorting domain-containing protein [Methylobacillus gramineus]MCB5183634.1 PEP-CTERM sorting domain-containing protein [Methylobacillus gramineus]
MSKRVYGLLLVSGFVWQLPVAMAADSGFSVGDFSDAEWTQYSIENTGGQVLNWSALDNTGGNPGSYSLLDFNKAATSQPGLSAIRVANIYDGFAYNPAVSGALDTLSFTFDAKGFSSNINTQVSAYLRPVILQNGISFSVASSDTIVTVGNWNTLTWSFTSASNWGDPYNDVEFNPDFSASGAPIQFGFRFSLNLSCSGAFGCRQTLARTGVDNFQVSVTAVPEPSAYAMMFAGLSLLGLARRRKMQQCV